MKQIGFVVRNSAGAVERGSVSAEQDVTAIQTGAGQEYSFNLRQSDILGFKRIGSNLEVALSDGRIILLEDFFNSAGQPVAQLYVSADTYISEVTLVEGANGELYGQYGVAETWGKYGASDDLIFLEGTEVAHADVGGEDVTMLGAGLIGGLSGLLGPVAGVVGGAGLLGGLGGGGAVAPTVAEGDVVIGGDEVTSEEESVTVTGTAEPGSEVVVTIGDSTVETTADGEGNWTATLEGEDFPGEGNWTTAVVITDGEGNETELEGPEVIIDLTGPVINVEDGVESTGDLVNGAGYADGVEISGTGEAGASISVTVGDVTHETVVDEEGNWSVVFDTSEVAAGEYETDVTIVSTDSYGNSTTAVETLVIDTVSNVSFSGASTGADMVVNGGEFDGGVTLTGTAEPGSSVVVTLDGVSHEASVDGAGNWSVEFAASELESGEYTGNVTVTATDAAGNVAETSGTVEFDTLVRNYTITTTTGGADGVVSGAEAEASGVTFGGTVEPGSTVVVEFGGHTYDATVDGAGNWSVTVPGADIPESNGGTITMTAVATDPAGNASTLTQNVVVDNAAGSLALSAAPIEADNIVNAAEASTGVAVRGTSDPGNVIEVQLGDATVTVTTGADGTWVANFAPSQVPGGQYTADIIATTTDAAGNSRTVTGTVDIDTEVRNLSVSGDDVTADNIVNSDERDDGVTFTGTTEEGTTSLIVTIDGVSRAANVDANGNWSVTFAAGDLPQGEDSFTLEAEATDRAGNVLTTSRQVAFDTLVNTLEGGAVEEGGTAVFNAADVRDGITVNGEVEPGSVVTVTFNNQTYTASVDGSGNWSVDLPASAFAAENYDAQIVIQATDAAGNVRSIQQTIEIDADIPGAPEVDGYGRDHTGYFAVQVVDGPEAQAVYEVDGTSVSEIADESDAIPFGDNNLFALTPSVQDGSHLVVAATDDAGNVSSTFMALDDPSSSVLDMSAVNPGLAGLEIEAIDLTFAEDTSLTLSFDQIEAFAENSDTLAIHGGSDDTVTITGATRTGQNIDGYDTYTIGDHTVLIDEDVTTVI